MNKNTPEEVLVLRFFESGPVDKVEAVFNIVCEKMRERGHGPSAAHDQASSPPRTRRRERPKLDVAAALPDSKDGEA